MSKVIVFLVLSMVCAIATGRVIKQQDTWIQDLNPGNEKFVKLDLYVQDIGAGPNQTAYEIARSNITSTSPTNFGQMFVIDNLLTAEPASNSTALGRVQGTITLSDLEVVGLTMNINYYFTTGKYNGSFLTVLGRNQLFNETRELPVVGGSGTFRMARGYSVSTTYSFDPVTNDRVVQCSFYLGYMELLDQIE